MAFAKRGIHTVLTGQVTGTLTDFVVLVSLTNNDFKQAGGGGYVANVNGYDIRFFSNYGLSSPLPFELEYYDAATGTIVFWVLNSAVADGLVFYSGFGDAALNTNASSTSTWPSCYKMVSHFPNGSTLSYKDSTSNAFDLSGANAPTAGTGPIDGGMHLALSSVQYATRAAAAITGFPCTLSAWAKVDNTTSASKMMVSVTNASSNEGFGLDFIAGINQYTRAIAVSSGGATVSAVNAFMPGLGPLDTTVWYFVQGVFIAIDNFLLYRDGSVLGTFGSGSGGANPTSLSATCAGAYLYSPSLVYGSFDGTLDETRITDTAVGPAQIAAEYNNQKPSAAFLSYASEAGGINSGMFMVLQN